MKQDQSASSCIVNWKIPIGRRLTFVRLSRAFASGIATPNAGQALAGPMSADVRAPGAASVFTIERAPADGACIADHRASARPLQGD